MAIAFGRRSQGNIAQLHGSLQRLLYAYADECPKSFDLTVTDSFRDEAAQDMAFTEGRSKKRWPDSAHNRKPAMAFDFCAAGPSDPYNRAEMLHRQGAIRFVAANLGIPLRPIIDWDLPHVELA